MNSTEFVSFAISFLEKETNASRDLLRKYMDTPQFNKPNDLKSIYFRMVGSIQNNQGMSNVIGKSLPNNIESLRSILFNFDPNQIAKAYSENTWDQLFDRIKTEVNPTGKLRDNKRSLWPKFCRGVIAAAVFLDQFDSGTEFHVWAEGFSKDPKSAAGLPLIISQEVYGIGFALACDFIKEIGYTEYGKPDVHIKRILLGTGRIPRYKNYLALKELSKIAEEAGETAYGVDKLLFLIGSGRFYMEDEVSKSIKRKRRGEQFVREYVEATSI